MRVALVNDMAMAVEALRRTVVSSREHQVAWIARDGIEAVDLCTRDTPDLILMDLIMPRMDGVEATRRIMERTPCAIVVVTADVAANSSKVFEAMGVGALDAVNTPVLQSPGSTEGASALLKKIDTIRRLLGRSTTVKPTHNLHPVEHPMNHEESLVAIGASAGGPAAVATILGSLAADFPAPIILVQHVDEQFARGLAEWLNDQTPLKVSLASEGEHPKPGTVLIAGREEHLIFSANGTLSYTANPADCSYRPSIDTFFQSAVACWPGDIVGVLLTGMGRDGAQGLRTLRERGHYTIAQDRESSAVYGMPKAAAELGAAHEILPANAIGPRLTLLLARKLKLHG